tara:strand:+ start:1694 stop:3181 length:1488 start_codon:yes stop_codon:yes gene_type:complete
MLKENLEKLSKIEMEFPVEDLNFHGTNWWPYLRVYLGTVSNNGNNLNVNHRNESNYLIGILKGLKRLLISFFSPSKKSFRSIYKKSSKKWSNLDVLLFGSSSSTKEHINGKKINQYTGPLGYYLKDDFKINQIEISENTEPSDYYFDTVTMNSYAKKELISFSLKNLIKRLIHPKSSRLPVVFEEFVSLVNERFQFNAISINQIYSDINAIRLYQYSFNNVFSVVRPNLLLLTGYYSKMNYAMILAAKDSEVLVVDVQHGVQGQMHRAYSKWGKIADNGYGLLPDYYFVYSEIEKTSLELSHNNSVKHKVVKVGNLWAELSLELNDGFDSRLIDKDRVNILLTPNTDEIPSWALDFLNENSDKYNWIVRMHPRGGDRDLLILKKLKNSGFQNFKVKGVLEQNIFQLLDAVDVHVTVHSSVAIDSVHCGMKSILLHSDAHIAYEEYISTNLVKHAQSYSELRNYIENYKAELVIASNINGAMKRRVVNIIDGLGLK